MSRTIEEKIVSMRFNNDNFEKNVAQSRKSLEALESSVDNMVDTSKKSSSAIQKLSSSVNNIDFSAMQQSLSALESRFSTMGVAGMRIIENLTDSAMEAASKIWNFAVGGVISGGLKRAMNLENADFQMMGLLENDLESVAAIMQNVQDSVDGTAYGLDAAAKVASQFAATGMRAGEDMYKALRGVAGVAAMTNSSYEDIGQLFTTISGNGRLMAQQLLSFSSKGLNVAATLAKELGRTEAEIRNMVSKGEISFQTFANAMDDAFGDHAKDANKTFSGAMSNIKSALSRIGAKFFSPLIKRENEVVELFNTIRVKINEFNSTINPFADFVTNGISKLATGLNTLIQGLDLTKNAFFAAFDDTTSNKLVELATEVINSWLNVSRIIKDAIAEVFDAPTTERIQQVLISIAEIPRKLKLLLGESTTNAENFKNTLLGIFSAFDIVKQIAIQLGKAVLPTIIESFRKIAEVFLSYTGSLGLAVKKLDEYIKRNNVIERGINKLLKPFKALAELIDKVNEKSLAASESKLAKAATLVVNAITKAVNKIKSVIDSINFEKVKGPLISFLKDIPGLISKITNGTLDKFNRIFKKLFESVDSLPYDRFFNLISAFGSITISKSLLTLINKFRSFFGSYKTVLSGNNQFSVILGTIKDTLVQYQKELKSEILLNIAKAISLLAVSLFVLSTIDATNLAATTAAIATLVVTLAGAMKILNSSLSVTTSDSKGNWLSQLINGFKDAKKMSTVGEQLTKMASAILILAVAMRVISDLDTEQLIRSVAAIGALITELSGAMVIMSNKLDPKAFAEGKITSMLLAMALAIDILSIACKRISEIPEDDITGGIVAITALLGALSVCIKAIAESDPRRMAFVGTALLGMAVSVLILTKACEKLATISRDNPEGMFNSLLSIVMIMGAISLSISNIRSVKTSQVLALGASMLAISASILIFARAMRSISKLRQNDIIKAVGSFTAIFMLMAVLSSAESVMSGKQMLALGAQMLMIGASVSIIASALTTIANIDTEKLVPALVGLGTALGLLAVGVYAMKESAVGANALLVSSLAIIILAGALKMLAKDDLTSLFSALVTLAGSLTILGLGAKALEPLIPAILKLSGAMFVFGLGLLLTGQGLNIASTGLIAFAGALAVFGASTLTIINALFDILPLLLNHIKEFLVGIFDLVIALTPKVGEVMTIMFKTLLDVATAMIPDFVESSLQLFLTLLSMLQEYGPTIADKLGDLLVVVIQALADDAKPLVDAAWTLVSAVADAIGEKLKGISADKIQNILLTVGMIAGLMALLNAVKAMGVGAMTGLAWVAVIAAELGVVLAAFGIISDALPGLKALIGEGGELLQSIGTAIGKFVGGILGGIADGVVSVLPSIGENLSKFMESLEPFINGAKQIDASFLAGIAALSAGILAVTASSFISGIANFVGTLFSVGASESLFVRVGKELANLAPYLKSFASITAGINMKEIETAVHAIELLARIDIPNTGGIIAFFAGDNTLDAFGAQMKGLGEGLLSFYASASAINVDVVYASVSALESIIGMLSGMSEINSYTINGIQLSLKNLGADSVQGFCDAFFNADAKMSEAIKSFVDGFTIKIYSYKTNFTEIFTSTFVDAANEIKFDDFTKYGSELINKLQSGMASKREIIFDTVKEIVNTCTTRLRETYSSFYNAGVYLVSGFSQGISNSTYSASVAATAMANAAAKAAAKALDEHSPSKVGYRIGDYFGVAFVNAISDYAGKSYDAAYGMGVSAKDGLNDTISNIAKIMDENVDSNPVIRPVLDLSNVETNSQKLSAMLSSNQAMKINASMNAALASDNSASTANPNNPVYNYTQNNYSPKALSAIEVYRNTKNQLQFNFNRSR